MYMFHVISKITYTVAFYWCKWFYDKMSILHGIDLHVIHKNM